MKGMIPQGKPWTQSCLWQLFSTPRGGVSYLALPTLARKYPRVLLSLRLAMRFEDQLMIIMDVYPSPVKAPMNCPFLTTG